MSELDITTQFGNDKRKSLQSLTGQMSNGS